MLSNDDKIKVRIKINAKRIRHQLPLTPISSYNRCELEQSDLLDPYKLMMIMRRNKIAVRGDKEMMSRSLLKRLYGVSFPVLTAKDIIMKFYTRYFLWKTGNGHLMQRYCINQRDFYTEISIFKIPKVFIFCYRDGNHAYVYDCRSLNEYYNENYCPVDFINPYTSTVFPVTIKDQFLRKIRWLKKLGFPTEHQKKNVRNITPKDKLKKHTVDVFQKLNEHQYVDYQWFLDLTFLEVKKLYYEMSDLWNYRLMIPESVKKQIVKNGRVFSNWKEVDKYTPIMFMKLQQQTLRNLARLVSEGESEDDRRTGSLYFMLGFVQVSQDAADSHPSLFQAAYNGDSD